MSEHEGYEEIEELVEVPRGTGIRGFLRTIETILRMKRLQGIDVDKNGRIRYRYLYARGETPPASRLPFVDLMPYATVRNSVVVELPSPDAHAAVAIGQLFARSAQDALFPVAFVTGTNTKYWAWQQETTPLHTELRTQLFGVPFFEDPNAEDYVLILCSAPTRESHLYDTVKSYKIVIPVTKTAEPLQGV